MASKQKVCDVLDQMAGVYRIDPLPIDVKNTYWEDLADVVDDDLAVAARVHRRDPARGMFFPKPADFLAALTSLHPKHPDAEAAWALVVPSFDERRTVVLTELMLAARAQVSELYAGGDRIGAALAFKSFYRMALAGAVGSEPPRWVVSAGFDGEERNRVVAEAQKNGLLGRRAAGALLSYQGGPADGAGGLSLPHSGEEGGLRRLVSTLRTAVGEPREKRKPEISAAEFRSAAAHDEILAREAARLRAWGSSAIDLLPQEEPGADEALGRAICDEIGKKNG